MQCLEKCKVCNLLKIIDSIHCSVTIHIFPSLLKPLSFQGRYSMLHHACSTKDSSRLLQAMLDSQAEATGRQKPLMPYSLGQTIKPTRFCRDQVSCLDMDKAGSNIYASVFVSSHCANRYFIPDNHQWVPALCPMSHFLFSCHSYSSYFPLDFSLFFQRTFTIFF